MFTHLGDYFDNVFIVKRNLKIVMANLAFVKF